MYRYYRDHKLFSCLGYPTLPDLSLDLKRRALKLDTSTYDAKEWQYLHSYPIL